MSRYGWKIAKSTLILKTTNQPIYTKKNFKTGHIKTLPEYPSDVNKKKSKPLISLPLFIVSGMGRSDDKATTRQLMWLVNILGPNFPEPYRQGTIKGQICQTKQKNDWSRQENIKKIWGS